MHDVVPKLQTKLPQPTWCLEGVLIQICGDDERLLKAAVCNGVRVTNVEASTGFRKEETIAKGVLRQDTTAVIFLPAEAAKNRQKMRQ